MANRALAGARVAVAGASGLLGSHVVEALADAGATVRGSCYRNSLAAGLPVREVHTCDLREPSSAARFVEGMDRLYICTGVVGGAELIGRSVAQVTQTLATAVQLMEAAALAGVERVGLVSSTTVYPPSAEPLVEEQGFAGDPFPSYFGLAWMNRSIEMVAAHLVRTGALSVAVIRPSSIYGPRDRFGPGAHVIPGLIGRALAGEDPFVVWGDGAAVRDFVHAADVADGLVAAVERAADAEPINIASGRGVTVAELVAAVLHATGHRPGELVFDAGKPTTIPVRRISIERARRRLGFEPRVGLEQGLRDTVKWYRTLG